MPRPKRIQKRRYRANVRRTKPDAGELPIEGQVVSIPNLQALLPIPMTLRFRLGSAVGLTTPWTSNMFLDLLATTVGGSATPVNLFNAVRLKSVKLWSNTATDNGARGIEFSPSLLAGAGGSFRIPTVSTSVNTDKNMLIHKVPKPSDAAFNVFTAQQGSFTLFNLQAWSQDVLQVEIVGMFNAGETPRTNAYTSGIAKGTFGVTNFGVAGCRSVGLTDLVNP